MSTVPPSSGPDHGVSASSATYTNSYCTPSDVYSRPFVLASTDAYPAGARVVLHTSVDSSTYAAAVEDAFQPHSSAPAASADAEKPLPRTVTGVPPSAAPRVGETDDTAAAGRYVKRTPLDENC